MAISAALILADLFIDAAAVPQSPDWPRLPALEYWLARADRSPLGMDWRSWLAQQEAASAVGQATWAAAECDATSWLAAPVHWVAGLDTLRLHPQGLLWLEPHEQQALAKDFARVFADSGWQLSACGAREMRLGSSTLLAADTATQDPARWLGSEPAAGLANGGGARTLKRLGAEIEMWLHEHPVNRARSERGQLTVSALWIWGRGLAALDHGQRTRALSGIAGALDRSPGATDARRAPIAAPIVLPLAGSQQALELRAAESRWFVPLLQRWRNGGGCLQLIANDSRFELAAVHRWRVWRRSKPWWQAL